LKTLPLAILLAFSSAPAFAADNAVMAADRAFSRLSVAKGAAFAFWTYTAQNGRLYSKSGPPRIGRSAKAPPPKTDQTVLSWEPTAGAVSDDGKLGWTDGTWKRAGKDGTQTGHYLTVWVKENDQWKVQADMGTADTAKKP
jgi:hypothetical protein